MITTPKREFRGARRKAARLRGVSETSGAASSARGPGPPRPETALVAGIQGPGAGRCAARGVAGVVGEELQARSPFKVGVSREAS